MKALGMPDRLKLGDKPENDRMYPKTEVKDHGWGQQGQIFNNWPREPFLSLNESSWHPDRNSHMSELVC